MGGLALNAGQLEDLFGGLEDLCVNVRVIAASNRDLEPLVREGAFREDLYYRLNVIPIALPPLRERREDIPEMAHRFLRHYATEFRKPIRGISDAGLSTLLNHGWPGNVRELKNVMERAVLLAGGSTLEPKDLVIGPHVQVASAFRLPPGGVVLEEVERDLLKQALDRAGGNQKRAAGLLGISRDTLRYRLKKFGLRSLAESD